MISFFQCGDSVVHEKGYVSWALSLTVESGKDLGEERLFLSPRDYEVGTFEE